MAQITTRPHWISSEGEVQLPVEPGRAIQHTLPEDLFITMVKLGAICQVNGETIDDWPNYVVQTDDDVRLYSYPAGGDRKGLLSTVAMLALSVYTGGLVAAGLSATTGAAITIGGSLVLGLVNNALIKPPKQPSVDAASNPFYALSTSRNQATPWGGVPRVYGRMKVAPAILQQPIKARYGQDQYLYMVYDFGAGPLKLIRSARIGDTPVGRYELGEEGAHIFTGEYKPDDNLELSVRNTVTVGVGADLERNKAITRKVPAGKSSVVVDFTFPRGLVTINSSNGSQSPTAVSFDVLVKYESEQAKPIDEQGRINWSDPSLISSIKGVTYYMQWDNWSTGSGRDSKSYYYGVRNGAEVGTVLLDIKYGNLDLQLADVTIRYPSSAGGLITKRQQLHFVRTEDNYNIYNIISIYPEEDFPEFTAYYGDRFRIVTTPVTITVPNINGFIVSGKSTTALALSLTFRPSDPSKEYDLIVRRDTVEANQYTQDLMHWLDYSYVDAEDSVFTPDITHTVAELRIKAQSQVQNAVDTYTAVVESILPAWTGTKWESKATRNPAWVFCDILRGSMVRKPLSDSQLDLAAIKEWADDCDRDVSGRGVLRCDMVIASKTTTKEALESVASVGRASPVYRDGKISVIRENDTGTPVQLITPKNSRNLVAQMSYIPPVRGVKATYLNADNDWEQAEESVYNPQYSGPNTTELETLDLPGTTSRTQAIRFARYFIAEGLLRRERASVEMDIENLIAQRGDLVRLSNDVMEVGGFPRRVIKVEGDTITIDEPVLGPNNSVRLRGSNTILPATLIAADAFTLSPGHGIQKDDILEWGATKTIVADYLVEEVQPGVDLSASVTLVEYRPEVLTAGNGTIPPRVPKPGADGEFAIGAVQALAIEQHTEFVERVRLITPVLTWSQPKGGWPASYNIYQVIAGVSTLIDNVTETMYRGRPVNQLSIDTVYAIQYEVQAVTMSDHAGPTTSITTDIRPDTVRPRNVTNFASNILQEEIHLYWDNLYEPDLAYYEVRFSPDTSVETAWANSTMLVAEIPYDATSVTVNARTGTYFIKGVDTSGNFSDVAAKTVTQVNELAEVDLFDTITFDPFAGGTTQDCSVQDGILQLDFGVYEGWWFADDTIEFPNPWLIRLVASIRMREYNPSELLDSEWFDPLANAIPLSPSRQQGDNFVDAQIMYKTSTDAQWHRLITADVNTDIVTFAIKLTTKRTDIVPRVLGASVLADWHERLEAGGDVDISEFGTDIDFTHPFAPIQGVIKRPTLTVSLQSANPGDTAVVLPHASKPANEGFRIVIYDANGDGVNGSIDWQAFGVGKGY